ncbi:MAG: formate dehydrogenase subunit alpha [Alphaproteobacteria bacterium]|nr:MAG: formate dehydrogenase subunit alpha [Alphaproteobacteria bacterium]
MSILKEKDFGTPARKTAEDITLEIDGHSVTVPEGTSVMRAAAEIGINIPKLCATDSLEAFGSCRLCVVEIEGRKSYPGSCHTTVTDGMKIKTQSEKLAKLRRNTMELYISDHPLDCLTCAANGDCELQDMAGVVGLRDQRYGDEGKNHLTSPKDESNPYFTFDPSKCIVCSRCVRACEEIQGTHALTVEGRGFDSVISPSQHNSFFESECVSCGACVDACPTATLMENSTIKHGIGEHSVITTCAYCGVGCSLKAEIKGDQLVRMTPYKDGHANEGHACVKGRFAWGYATHPDRITTPMIREKITDPWRDVSWKEALDYTASAFKRIQKEYGVKAIGGITSSRCTAEETFLVQKLVRAGFGNNNIDNCARVCHAPTGYGLRETLGTSAGTQNFASVAQSDVILLIGANPAEAHPVFASRLKHRLREGAQIIVIDPRKQAFVDSPHIKAAFHLPLRPGTNVAMLNALAHVIATENLFDETFIKTQCEEFETWRDFISDEKHSPEEAEKTTGVPADDIRSAARLYAKAGNAAIYYGLGITEHSQGSTAVIGLANLAMATGNLGREGVGVNPLRGQNNVQGACDVGGFPHQFPGYRSVTDKKTREIFEKEWGVPLDDEPGLRIPNMIDAAHAGSFKGIYIQGEDIVQSDPNSQHIAAGLEAMECVVIHDIFLNETSKYAHVFLPGSSFLEKDGTFINAERRINRIRKIKEPLGGLADWQGTVALSKAMGYDMDYSHPSEVMDEIARTTPAFSGVSYEKLDRLGSVQWPCNEENPEGTPVMHIGKIVRNPGRFVITEFVPTEEKTNKKFPLILTTGRILAQYNVGTQTRRTANNAWCSEDLLEIHEHDAEQRGISDGDLVAIQSRSGAISLRAKISQRVQPGVVYTSFHFAESGTNVVTTKQSDWATECPEYKVVAVEVRLTNDLSDWQKKVHQSHRDEPRLTADAE